MTEEGVGLSGGPGTQGAGGHLPGNLALFGRLLRGAGLPVGPGRLIEALRALQIVDITDGAEFYWALHAVFVHRKDEAETFARAFHLFWREPALREAALADLSGRPQLHPSAGEASLPVQAEEGARDAASPGGETAADVEGSFLPGFSFKDALKKKDFENMSDEELAEARRVVSRMQFTVDPLPIRRYRADPHGRSVDLRATLKASVRAGEGTIPLQFRTHRRRPPALVALCDISGSMRSYTRMLLHFLHALTEQRDRVHTFLFGTRLTNATPYLRRRDPDEAMRQLGDAVLDWDGGTRIGASLAEFNRRWSRRVLTRGAVVLLITDGLDQESAGGLEAAMRRLRDSCRRLVWLNPLLRHEEFEPQAAGIRAILPYVDDLRTIHNLESFSDLSDALEDLNRPVKRHRWRGPLVPLAVRAPSAESLAKLWVPKEKLPPVHPRVAPPEKGRKGR